jgi:hypothetical protein
MHPATWRRGQAELDRINAAGKSQEVGAHRIARFPKSGVASRCSSQIAVLPHLPSVDQPTLTI